MFLRAEALVQFDYEAREPDELTLKKGDIITDVKPMPDGWMEGFKDGKKGMFPDNYVRVPIPSPCLITTNNYCPIIVDCYLCRYRSFTILQVSF